MKQYEPLVSIVIPVYNPGAYFHRCIKSVRQQRYRRIEIIVVNDGSVSAYHSIFKSLTDIGIKVITTKHSGAGGARNVGLEAASGDYVCFIDADDFVEPNMLSDMVAQITLNKAEIAVCSFYVYDSKKEDDIYIQPILFTTESVLTTKLLNKILFRAFSPNVWNKLFSTSFLRRNKILFDQLTTCNDFTFVYTALACSKRIAIIQDAFIHYRIGHSGNISSVRSTHSINICKSILNLKRELIKRNLYRQYSSTLYDRALLSMSHEMMQCNFKQNCLFLKEGIKILPADVLVGILLSIVEFPIFSLVNLYKYRKKK